MKELQVITTTIEETHALGERIARAAAPDMVILLDGDLGAGKTTLTQGIAKGLGVKRRVTSPTFNILKIYHGSIPLYHIDAYRLEGISQDLGFDELLDDEGLTVIEWSEYVPGLVPVHYLRISIRLLEDTKRQFSFSAIGEEYEKLLEVIK